MILASQPFYDLMVLPKLVEQIQSYLQSGYCASAWSLSRLRKVKVGSLFTLHPAALVSISFHSIPKPRFQLLGTEIQKIIARCVGGFSLTYFSCRLYYLAPTVEGIFHTMQHSLGGSLGDCEKAETAVWLSEVLYMGTGSISMAAWCVLCLSWVAQSFSIS